MHALIRLAAVAIVVSVAGCASSGKPQAVAEEKPITVTVPAPVADKDALGNYRFLMQQEGVNMSADQFDAWLKANGIRVARGNAAPPAGTEAAAGEKN